MMHRQIADRMFADELLEGHNMPVVAAGQIIIMKDAAVRPERPKGLKQTTLEAFNFRVKKKGLKQTTLMKYNFRVVSHE